MERLTVKTIRNMVKQLMSADVLPRDITAFIPVELRDGTVYLGSGAMHPSSFLDNFGVTKFRKLKRDVTKQQIEDYIKTWKKNKKK